MEKLFPKVQPARRCLYVRKSIAIDIFQVIGLTLLSEREYCHRKELNIFLMSNASNLISYLPQAHPNHLKIQYLYCPELKNSVFMRFAWFTWKQCSCGWRILREMFNKPSNKSSLLPTIALEYGWGMNYAQNLKELWWFEQSKLSNSRCIVFFEHPRKKPDLERIQEMQQLGVRYRFLRKYGKSYPFKLDHFSQQRKKYILPDLMKALQLMLCIRTLPAPLWQIRQGIISLWHVRRFQAFIEAENIKIIFDTSEFSPDFSAIAADLTGAVKLGIHWSDIDSPRATMHPLQQVYWTWGNRTREVLEGIGTANNISINSGSIYNHKEAQIQQYQNAKSYREKLAKCVAYTICILDATCGPKSHYPPIYHIEFYEAMIKHAETDPNLGLIFKPKDTPPSIFLYKPCLSKRIENLQKEKRAILIDSHESPLVASYFSGITVGLGISSAGFLCTMEDRRTVYFVPSFESKGPAAYWMKHLGWDDPNIIFNNMEKLMEKVMQYLQAPSKDSKLGIFSKVKEKADPFRDGRAAERIGEFCCQFLENIELGMQREQALDNSAKIYAEKWGNSTIKRFDLEKPYKSSIFSQKQRNRVRV